MQVIVKALKKSIPHSVKVTREMSTITCTPLLPAGLCPRDFAAVGIIGNVEYKNKTKQNNLTEPTLTSMSDNLQHFFFINFDFAYIYMG